jgi:hypothetical protein
MATVETTTVRLRRGTQRRLAKEAQIAGKSVVDMLDVAVDLVEEQRLLASMDESYREHGDEIREEMQAWLELPDGWPDADR